jgi:signal transduction histidine kinase
MKLSHKLLGSFSVLVVMFAGVGIFSVYRMNEINRASYDMSTNWMPSIKVLGEMGFRFSSFRRKELSYVFTTDAEQARQFKGEMDALLPAIEGKFKEYEPLISEPEERENYPRIRAMWSEYLAIHARILDLLGRNEQQAAAGLALGDEHILFTKLMDVLAFLVDVNARGGQHSADAAVQGFMDAKALISLLIGLSGIVGVSLSLWLTRNVVTQLGEDPGYLHDVSCELADGQLEATFKPVKRKGSVYGVLMEMVANLKSKIEETNQKSAELKAKNDELEQVFYVASHDLRSPLVNIDGYGKELAFSVSDLRKALSGLPLPPESLRAVTSLLDEDIPESLRFIQTSTSKMDALLTGLLRLSRLGRAALNMERLDMNALLSRIVDSTEFKIKEAGVTLDLGELPACVGDEVQVEQVFSNLLDNALKYLSPDRPGVIRITGEVSDEHCVYCVEDNGIGIDPAHQGMIFEIFHRLDPARGTGEGLGLTIVKRVLSRLGGRVWVSSEAGVGSRFFVALPAGPAKQATSGRREADA